MSAGQSPKSEDTPKRPVLQLFSLEGKIALITGATRGIGQACAVALAEAGADIILVQRPGSANFATRDLILSLPERQCEIIECDMGDMEGVKGIVNQALRLKLFGKGRGLDILVNCAGIQSRAPATEFAEEEWDNVINVNLKSNFLLCQAAGKHMISRRKGKIINFASLLTFQGGLTVPAYAAAKGGIGQLTKALSNEWAQHNVQVNGIAPGYIATEMNEALLSNPTRLRQISERIPAGRWGSPSDFGGPIVFLASEGSSYVNGEILVVDGGWMGR